MWYHDKPKLSDEAWDTPVWRYLDLAKYLELLRSETLWFSAANRLGDPWEGALFGEPATVQGIEGLDVPLVKRGMKYRRRVTCISCWHSANRESAAMWNHYGHQGVAVIAEPLTLAYGDALPRLGDLWHAVGSVHYVDHQAINEWPANAFAPFFAKRLGFESEREVRIVIEDEYVFDDATRDGGIAMSVDLSILISEVRVSPEAPPYLFDVVREATSAFGCEAPVRQSDLSPPVRW